MLEKHIQSLIKDLDIRSSLTTEVPGTYALPLDDGLNVMISEMPQGFMLKSTLAQCPKVNEEMFLTQMMLANLFGQGTKGAILGLNTDGNQLVLTQTIDYPASYKDFRDLLEDFINTVDFWREEALAHK